MCYYYLCCRAKSEFRSTWDIDDLIGNSMKSRFVRTKSGSFSTDSINGCACILLTRFSVKLDAADDQDDERFFCSSRDDEERLKRCSSLATITKYPSSEPTRRTTLKLCSRAIFCAVSKSLTDIFITQWSDSACCPLLLLLLLLLLTVLSSNDDGAVIVRWANAATNSTRRFIVLDGDFIVRGRLIYLCMIEGRRHKMTTCKQKRDDWRFMTLDVHNQMEVFFWFVVYLYI